MFSAGASKNLCLFEAIFNALEPSNQFIFANGDLLHPDQHFVQEFLDHGGNADEFGYDANAIRLYLGHLQRTGRCSGFEWRHLRNFRLDEICTRGFGAGTILVMFGLSAYPDQATKMAKLVTEAGRLKRLMPADYQANNLRGQVLRYYLLEADYYRANSPGHAVAIKFEVIGERVRPVIYDSGKRTSKPFTMYSFCLSLVNLYAVYELVIVA
jgi:hypothetical protein